MFNLSSLDARLFSYLYLTEKPKTLDDMSEALDKSKTSMSTSARNLYDKNLITLVWQKGVRKDLYEANTNLFKIFMNSQLNQFNNSIHHQKEAIQNIRNTFDQDGDSKGDHEFEQRIQDIISFHQQINDLLKEIKRVQ